MTLLDLADACRPPLGHSEAKRIAFKAAPCLRACDWRIAELEASEVDKLRPLFEAVARAGGPELPGITPEPAPTPFLFDHHARVRVIGREGEPWFIAADVCEALGIRNTSDALSRLSADERSTIGNPESRNGGGHLLIISESGLYGLVLRCQGATTEGTPAYRFSRWVTHEVLPAIRGRGEYKAPAPKPPASPKPPVRALSAALVREYRLAAKDKIITATDFQLLVGLPGLRALPEPEEGKAPLELGERKFAEIRARLGAGAQA